MDPTWDLRDNSVSIPGDRFPPRRNFCYFISTMLPLSNLRFRIVEFVKLSYDDEIFSINSVVVYSLWNFLSFGFGYETNIARIGASPSFYVNKESEISILLFKQTWPNQFIIIIHSSYNRRYWWTLIPDQEKVRLLSALQGRHFDDPLYFGSF